LWFCLQRRAKRSAKKVSVTLWFSRLQCRCTTICFVCFYHSELCRVCSYLYGLRVWRQIH